MKQEFNRAMDQVTLPPRRQARINEVVGWHGGKTGPKAAASPPAPRPRQGNGKGGKTRRRGRSRRDPDDRRSLCRRLSGGGAGPVFPGDTGSLEPYVQTTIPSAEHEGYRLTVDNSLYDGQNLYILMTVEALNQQAASELEHLRIASPHTICWALASPGSSDTAQITAHSMGVQELPARTDASRTWQVDLNFDGFMGKQDRPLLLWLDFMGEDHAVSIPLDTMLEPIHLTPNEPVTIDTITGQQAILKEFTLSATSYSLELQVEGLPAHTRPQTYTVPLFLRMKDGSVLTRHSCSAPAADSSSALCWTSHRWRL